MKDSASVLLMIINLLSSRLMNLGEHRSHFFLVIHTLIEKSPDADLLFDLTKLVSNWIREQSNATILSF